MEQFTPFIQWVFYGGLLISMLPLVYRIIKGPHIVDRIMCVDSISLVAVCMMAVWNLSVQTSFFFNAVVTLAIVGFIGTVAFVKYLENGDLVD